MKQTADTQKIINVIKYDTRRNYFGNWTPGQIHAAYHDAMENPDHGFNIFIGTISINSVCGALWNEMSYNPIRFGFESPFLVNGSNNLDSFCKNNLPDASQKPIQEHVQRFFSIAKQIDENFEKTGKFSKNNITIKSTYGTISMNYIMLSALARAIHAIATINLTDFKSSKQHRKKITEIVQSRHPDLIRNKANIDFDKFETYQLELKSIEHEIYVLNNKIDTISYTINDKQEYEQPIDTTYEEHQISQINQKIDTLMSRHEFIQYQLNNLVNHR